MSEVYNEFSQTWSVRPVRGHIKSRDSTERRDWKEVCDCAWMVRACSAREGSLTRLDNRFTRRFTCPRDAMTLTFAHADLRRKPTKQRRKVTFMQLSGQILTCMPQIVKDKTFLVSLRLVAAELKGFSLRLKEMSCCFHGILPHWRSTLEVVNFYYEEICVQKYEIETKEWFLPKIWSMYTFEKEKKMVDWNIFWNF